MKKIKIWAKSRTKIRGKNNKIILIKNGKETALPRWRNAVFGFNIKISGNNNIVKIELPQPGRPLISIVFNNTQSSIVYIRENFSDKASLDLWGRDNFVEIGKHSHGGGLKIVSVDSIIKIGERLMCAGNAAIWADGHAVTNADKSVVLNLPKEPIIIGSHVWLGEGARLTKGAQIADNCIVGMGAVVTKKFAMPNCLIAGNPAKVMKENINWDYPTPAAYHNFINPKS